MPPLVLRQLGFCDSLRNQYVLSLCSTSIQGEFEQIRLDEATTGTPWKTGNLTAVQM